MAADASPEVERRLGEAGIDFVPISLARAGLDPRKDVGSLLALVRTFRTLRPDLVLAYTIKPVIYGTLAARFAGVPARFAMITGLGYTFLGDGLRRRVLRTIASTLYRIALDGANGLFLQNEDDRADLAATGALPRRLPITIVRGSGVDVDHYAAAPMPGGPPRFLFVGRLLREKGILAFVELAKTIRAAHPDVVFEIAGGLDPNPASISRAQLETWIAQGLVRYAGEVADVRPVLARCHVLVLPSDREGTPRSVLEAMSTGRPVIVTDVPGCRDTIVDGEHGLLVPHGDAPALAAAARRLLDAATREHMGRAARSRILALYDARRIAEQMLDVMGL